MSKTVNQLKSAVAGFMHRDPRVFVRPAQTGTTGYLCDENGERILTAENEPIVIGYAGCEAFDLLLQAMNNARLYAERKIDFELSIAQVTIPSVSATSGASLLTAVLKDTTTACRIKKIRTPFLALSDGSTFPVELWHKSRWNERLKRRYALASPLDPASQLDFTESPFSVVQDGNTVFVSPMDTNALGSTFDLELEALVWMDEYVTGAETDFLLDYCFDWLMYRCIFELNFFLKEDERVALSDRLMKESWDAVVGWNNELIKSGSDDSTLD